MFNKAKAKNIIYALKFLIDLKYNTNKNITTENYFQHVLILLIQLISSIIFNNVWAHELQNLD